MLRRQAVPLPRVSQEGMDRIRLAIEAFNRRDVDAMLSWNHPDVVYQTAIASMEGEERRLPRSRRRTAVEERSG